MNDLRRSAFLSFIVAVLAITEMTGCGGSATPSGSGTPSTFRPTAVGYVAVTKADSVTSFLLDETTGELRPGQTVSTGEFPGQAVITPERRHLFVNNIKAHSISIYSVPGNGAITPAGPPATLANPSAFPWHMVVAPSGKFLFVSTTPNAVEVFRIDAQSGALTPAPGSPFTVASTISFLALTHSGEYLYVASSSNDINSDVLYRFSVDLQTGSLTPLPNTHTGFVNCAIAIDPADKFMLINDCNSGRLYGYRIQPPFILEQTPGSGLLSGYQSVSLAFTPNGRFVYMEDPFWRGDSSSYDNGILGYSFDTSTGAIADIPGSPFRDNQSSSSVGVAPRGTTLVVTRINPGHIASYRIDMQTGTLTPISGLLSDSGLSTGDSPNHVLIVPSE